MSRSGVQKDLRFLQSLVNEDLDRKQERTDSSDKENEAGLTTNTSYNSTAAVPTHQSANVKMEQKHEIYGQGTSININHGMNERKQDIWDDFLSVEEIQKKKGRNERKKDIFDYTVITSLANLEKEDKITPNKLQVSEKVAKFQRQDDTNEDKYPDKKRKKQLFKQVAHTSLAPAATGGSHPDLSHHDNNRNHHLETMSETSGRQSRRLGRRKQVTRPRCAGPEPSGDTLQQKIQELHALLVKPLVEPKQFMYQTRQELLHLQGISQHNAGHIKETLPHQNGFRRGKDQQAFAELTTENADDGYFALRTVQIQGTKPHRAQTFDNAKKQLLSGKGHRERTFSVGHQEDSSQQKTTKNLRHSPDNFFSSRGRERSKKKESNKSSEGSRSESLRNSENVKNSENVRNNQNVRNSSHNERSHDLHKHASSQKSDETVRSSSGSPTRVIQHSDTHLKNSNNPALRKWLKKKNKELRRQKAEERKRLKEERAKSEDEVRAKQELFKDSDKKVKEWMIQKRKEAWKNAKEKKRIMMEEEKERLEREQQRHGMRVMRTRSVERPLATQTLHDKNIFISIIRPDSTQGQTTEDREDQGDIHSTESSSPHSPATKFVYKRPVSGHVRLMKLQQKQKGDAKRSEQEKKLLEKKSAQKKTKKMRMSYDQWLLKKRTEDYVKRQEVAKQKALTKSDPELDRILPELARKRIDHILCGKKRIDTGINMLNNELNKSFGGADFGSETEDKTASDQRKHKIQVTGQKEVLKLRPSTAEPFLNSKNSQSPHRRIPRSPLAQVPLQTEVNGQYSEPKPFRLPFPPHRGAPQHVITTQKKLFPAHITSNVSNSSAAESQDESTLKTSDSIEANKELPRDIQEEHENTVSQEMNDTNPDVPRTESSEDTSFFLTHGNLGATEQDKAEGKYQQESFGDAMQGKSDDVYQQSNQEPLKTHYAATSEHLVEGMDILNHENVEEAAESYDPHESYTTSTEDYQLENNVINNGENGVTADRDIDHIIEDVHEQLEFLEALNIDKNNYNQLEDEEEVTGNETEKEIEQEEANFTFPNEDLPDLQDVADITGGNSEHSFGEDNSESLDSKNVETNDSSWNKDVYHVPCDNLEALNLNNDNNLKVENDKDLTDNETEVGNEQMEEDKFNSDYEQDLPGL